MRPISSGALRHAIALRQVLHLVGMSSMGDQELRWRLADPSDLECRHEEGLVFHFPTASA